MGEINILPEAAEIIKGSKEHVHGFGVKSEYKGFDCAVPVFYQDIKKTAGVINSSEDGIILRYDGALSVDEYKIHADEKSVILTASALSGINHALICIVQSLRVCDGGHFIIPDMDIHDFPAKPYRGLMLDLARFFHPLDVLLNAVDLCRMYRLSTLHLHFCDDQSYTLPSDILPGLSTENRHYTVNDIKTLTEYARVCGVNIMPEIEMPGHCRRLQRVYPDIFGTSGILRASEKTFEYLEKLIKEVISMFPDSSMLHIGGDEANLKAWENDRETAEYMKTKGIDNFHDLYTHYVARSVDTVLKYGKIPAVWEGFSEAANEKIDKRCVVFEFESYYQLAPSLIKSGFNVINASWKPMYIVPPHKYWSPCETDLWNVYKWMNWWSESKAYYNDIIVEPTEKVAGAQLCVWGDDMDSYGDCKRAINEEFRLIRERISYLAEKSWNAGRDIPGAPYPKRQNIYDKTALLMR